MYMYYVFLKYYSCSCHYKFLFCSLSLSSLFSPLIFPSFPLQFFPLFHSFHVPLFTFSFLLSTRLITLATHTLPDNVGDSVITDVLKSLFCLAGLRGKQVALIFEVKYFIFMSNNYYYM